MDVDMISVSVEGTGRHSDDSDIDVIACYRHVPWGSQIRFTPRKMTTDPSICVDDALPEFPWNGLVDLWPEEFQPTKIELGTGPNALGHENHCPIGQCSNLIPLVDTLLSPTLSEQGPSYGRYDYAGANVTDFHAPLNSHIQGISVRMGANCGEMNVAIYGDCFVCGSSYEQIRETAVLTYLESTSRRDDSYQERQRPRNAYLEGLNQAKILYVLRGVSQAVLATGITIKFPENTRKPTPYL